MFEFFSQLPENYWETARPILGLIAVPVLGVWAWRLWVKYVNLFFITKIEWVNIEIRIPKELYKSPAAMELILINAFYQSGGTGNWYQKYWQGNVRMWFSLEIVSIEGALYFFIRTPKKFKGLIESQIYAQYPQAELMEVPDYTLEVARARTKEEWSMFGTEFVLDKEKNEAFPIKTYIDYDMDKALVEEAQRIDPMSGTLEYMAAVGKNEHVWFQLLITADTKRFPVEGAWFKTMDWRKKMLLDLETLKSKFKPKDKEIVAPMVTKNDQEIINSLERAVNKFGFDCGIRVMYLAKKENFNANNITGLMGMLRQYTTYHGNKFGPKNGTSFEYPWQDFTGTRVKAKKEELFEAYCARSYFQQPHNSVGGSERVPFILNTEEIATIYHFPGSVLETPTFKRIDSKKSEPPQNLPI
jgi:hypothetical protein